MNPNDFKHEYESIHTRLGYLAREVSRLSDKACKKNNRFPDSGDELGDLASLFTSIDRSMRMTQNLIRRVEQRGEKPQ